ncbi:hypothetical protein [Streptomyces sp. NPDC059168]|uniref:hypothetical protein n=1 Tax=Streptomyces sp. NPDC059168 TaxID=3346753 RepID=UPI0036AB0335
MPREGNSGIRVRDQSLLSAVVVGRNQAEDTESAASDQWLVIVDDSGIPIDAIRPGASHRPLVIVAEGNLDVDEALTAPAFRDLEADDTGVVVVEDRQVLGVWTGAELERAVTTSAAARRLPRGRGMATNGRLPGVPGIPHITRTCAYVEHGATCGAVHSFPKKPRAMPACANNSKALAAHTFVW